MGHDAWAFDNVQVRMLSADEELNEETLRGILQAGHSRVPVHRPGSRCAAHAPVQLSCWSHAGARVWDVTTCITIHIYSLI